MTPIPSALALLAAACPVVGLLAARFRQRRTKGFLEISPRYRTFFRQLGITETSHFLALPGAAPHIVSGHPDRNVARIRFASGAEGWNAFLKCEHRVRWWTRLANAAAGFGFLSRSLREARTLQALEREGLPGPEWLAAGEDGRGRAFLLVREAPGVELRAVLEAEKEPRRRRLLARKLGAVLARLHTAGFRHPDLYANHLFVDGGAGSIHLLDWQRACLRRTLSWWERCRDLAALHATLADSLAAPQERLLCLRSYWRISATPAVSWQVAVRRIEATARRLLARRHIREKRQPPVQAQAWICLAGESLCVTPALQERCGKRMMDYLPSFGEMHSSSTRRCWQALPDASRVLLVQRDRQESSAPMWLRPRRAAISPEQRQAALLLRLQRHGIAAPQVLALGQDHNKAGRNGGFLLTEPLPDICSMEAWLAYRSRRQTGAAESARRCSVLRQAGAFVRCLHEANCYLDFDSSGCGLAVRREGEQATVVLDNVDHLTSRRRGQPRRAARDLRQMQRMLRWAGCSRSDLCRFHAGYLGENPKSEIRNPTEIQRKKSKNSNETAPGFGSSVIYYGWRFLSDFGFRISDFPRLRCDSLWRRLLLGVRRLRQHPDWPRFAGEDWADRIMDVAVTDRFHAKQGRSTGRWIVTEKTSGQEQTRRLSVYLKRHYRLPWWRGWLATLWPQQNWSAAWQEWRHVEWARRQGLPVPRTVAAAEYIGPWGKLRSFLAVEELAGMVSLQEAIPLAAVRQDALLFRRWKRGLAVEMARLTRMLHDRRCFHKDLYLCHFFIAGEDTRDVPAEGWRGRVYLIDLHRLAHHPLARRMWQTKDLAELLYASDIIGVDARDRLAFWRAYCGFGPHRPRCPWMRRLVLFRWRRYRHHNARGERAARDEPSWRRLASAKSALDL